MMMRVVVILLPALLLAACGRKEECLKSCAVSYESCMQRINDTEKCLFFKQDCEGRCS